MSYNNSIVSILSGVYHVLISCKKYGALTDLTSLELWLSTASAGNKKIDFLFVYIDDKPWSQLSHF